MVRRTLTLPVAPTELWPVLADPGSWLGGDMRWALTEGGPLRFDGADGEHRDGRVGEVRRAEVLRFTWWTDGGEASEVTWTLEPSPAGTELTVEEVPVAKPPAATSARWGAEDDAALARHRDFLCAVSA
ncbi:MAG TPA: SRPBCC domain-containing protein [Acidimicrobiales bacterium]|nr:SRPBCC domain-containing protein [Acidimicrobiales bacterium]